MVGTFADSGLFIAFEGGEGCGKSTQSARLAETLRARGRVVELTREPGGTPVGSALRRILLDPATGNISPRAEALIYAADRAEHVEHFIIGALERGEVVVSDRYIDSTLAYQGAGRSLNLAELAELNRWATSGLRPHLTVVLDLDPVVGLERAGDHDRIEAEPLEFHRRVREHFLAMAAADPQHYTIIDATADPAAVEEHVLEAVRPWLGES